MASSTLTGDRRWAPTRKSGMTVLGKVPKPINLPSQRLENHGLDPNVEIVPKGTLTWGSRPSSASPNVWGSSTQSSPNTDGSVGSPSQLNGRPSSGGSGTRPSTAGSDRSFEPISNAWTSNSRPSSASAVPVSNLSSMTTRPRSAETRPGSSQLSRFAEPIPENSVPWAAGTSERLGSSKVTDFTLTSGDFPTLGSEKNLELHVQQANHSSHGRPSSASGTATAQKERLEVTPSGDEAVNISDKKIANTWKLDTPPYAAAGGPPDIDNWDRDPHMAQSYPNLNLQQHYNAWHGPPVHNPPDGVWYRGVTPGGPYRSTGPPGNYPMEPFAYYPSQLPAGSASNSQSAPRAGAVLGGYPHKNGEPFRPQMAPDSYIVPTAPVIPVRPGVYPGPVPYDGYYGPSRPNMEKPTSGKTTRHGICNPYQHQNAPREPGNFHAQSSGYVGSGVNHQHMEVSHAHETHGGHYRVLLKQHDGYVCNNSSNEKREQSLVGNTPHLGFTNRPAAILRESDRVGARNTEKEVEIVEGSSVAPTSDYGSNFQAASVAKLPETSSEAKVVDDFPQKTSNPGITLRDSQQYPVKKNTLIEKIEGLNNKGWIADGRSEGPSVTKGDYTWRSKNEKIKVDKSTGLVNSHAVSFESVSTFTEKCLTCIVPDSHVILETSTKEKSHDRANVTVMPQSSEIHPVIGSDPLGVGPRIHSHDQKNVHGLYSGAESYAKTRNSSSGGDEWRKQLSKNDSSFANAINKMENCSEAGLHPVSQEHPNQQGSHNANKDGDEAYVLSSLDPIDYQAQRAKMKEIATQRAKELQKEEEERTREQKAKALAKLEELNKRTLTESSNKNGNLVPQPNNVFQISLDPVDHAPKPDAAIVETVNCAMISSVDVQASGGDSCKTEGTDMVQKIGTSAVGNEESILVQTSDSGTVKPKSNSGQSKPGGGFNSVPKSDSVHNNLGHSALAKPKIHDSCSNKDTQVTSYNSSLPNDPSAPISSKTANIQDSSVTKQRQIGHRKKQSIQQEKSFGESPISPLDTDSHKVQEFNCRYVSTADVLTSNSNEIGDSLAQNKKKNNRGSRYKHKPGEALLVSTLPPSHDEGILENPSESGITRSLGAISEAVPIADQVSQETMKGQHPRDALVSSSQGWFQGDDEGREKAVNQWKPQPPRRTTRNTQTRTADKIHGAEAVWAPVKPMSKSEPTVVAYNGRSEASGHSSDKNVNDAQSKLKSKRAEMERYVPKLITKELSRQGSTHQPSDLYQAAPTEVNSNLDTGSSLIEVSVESKKWDHGKPIKHGKSHASWRQRGPHEEACSPDAIETVRQHFNDKQSTELDTSFRHTTHSSDGWSMDNANVPPNDSVVVSLGNKGTASRAKRQGHKVPKVVVSNDTISDTKNLPRGSADKLDTQPPASGWSELDAKSSFSNRIVGEHARSQWKPKSQVCSSHSQQEGNRDMEGQQVPLQSGITDIGSLVQFVGDHQVQNAENKNNLGPNSVNPEKRNAHHHETRRERRFMTGSLKDPSGSPNQNSSHVAEPPQQGQGPSGLRRYGQHNGRFDKGQETNRVGGGRGLGQDTGKHNLPTKIDRSRHTSHYGYQKVESHNKTADSSQSNVTVSEDPKDTFHAIGPSYRGRGQNHFRRGHFYVRNNGPPTHAGDTHDGRE